MEQLTCYAEVQYSLCGSVVEISQHHETQVSFLNTAFEVKAHCFTFLTMREEFRDQVMTGDMDAKKLEPCHMLHQSSTDVDGDVCMALTIISLVFCMLIARLSSAHHVARC